MKCVHIWLQEQPAYNPQVEAISPTLPPDSMQEDAAFRATKDDLLQQIAKVDREIAKAESEIAKLKKKQHELEEAANKPSIKKEEEEITQPKHQSPAQKIYAENRVSKFVSS
jgi:nuclear receptor co-repressor 1